MPQRNLLKNLKQMESSLRKSVAGKTHASHRESSVPLFQQVKDYIIGRIESGTWPPNTRVPSENELIKALSISRMTVNRALRELTIEGYLKRVQGLGTSVAEPRAQSALFTIRPISDEIHQRGSVHSAEVHMLTQETASPEVALSLGLETGAIVFRSVIIHKADGSPVQLADRYVNPAVAPDFLQQDFSKITPSHYLFQIGPLTKAEHIFEAAMPDEITRKLLKIQASEPCLVLNRRTWINQNVASKARLIHPGSRFKIGGIFVPRTTMTPSVG
jgi:GntR family transcriptional regulator, histidine utilization repressor